MRKLKKMIQMNFVSLKMIQNRNFVSKMIQNRIRHTHIENKLIRRKNLKNRCTCGKLNHFTSKTNTVNQLHTVSGFPGCSAVQNLPANTGNTRDVGAIPGSGIP